MGGGKMQEQKGENRGFFPHLTFSAKFIRRRIKEKVDKMRLRIQFRTAGIYLRYPDRERSAGLWPLHQISGIQRYSGKRKYLYPNGIVMHGVCINNNKRVYYYSEWLQICNEKFAFTDI